MFVSDSSKLAVYYTCQRQRAELRYYQTYQFFSYQRSKVADWYLHCQAWNPHIIYSWLDMLCPFKFGAPNNGPDGWHLGLPWFAAQLEEEERAAKRRRTTD